MKAKKSHDFTVQARVKKLTPATEYKYRFCARGGRHSDTGTFTTAPKPNSKRTIRFALSGDQDARPVPGGTTPYWNNFEIWNQIKKQNNDFNVLMGDTIYSDTEVPGYGLSDVATSVKQKWAAYKTNLAMKPWAKTRGAAAYYAHWDDHEFVNDFSRFENSFPLSVGDVNMNGEKLYKNGVQAFTDYNPITYSKQTGIYRSVTLGQEPRGLLPRRAVLPQRQRRLSGHLRQPGRQRQSRPGADRAAEHPRRLRGDLAAAVEPGSGGLLGRDQRPEPDDARRQAAEASSRRRSRSRARPSR